MAIIQKKFWIPDWIGNDKWDVMPVQTGIQKVPGFPVKPGMTKRYVMPVKLVPNIDWGTGIQKTPWIPDWIGNDRKVMPVKTGIQKTPWIPDGFYTECNEVRE